MIVLINAGGSGTRLWPLSTKQFPKQFINLIDDSSLLQDAYQRALLVTDADKIFVSTGEQYVSIVAEQLPDLKSSHIISEPDRRDTMGCILNAFQYIASLTSEEEVIASIWSDNYIRDKEAFAKDTIQAAELSKQTNRMILFGMIPDRPGPKFGHIHKGKNFKTTKNVFEVAGFKEKPEYELAKEYQESGEYLWNSGTFTASYKTLRSKVEKYSDKEWLDNLKRLESCKSKDERRKIYLDFKREAMEYALNEKVPDLLVVAQNFTWEDLGSFDDVYNINSKDEEGNLISSSNRIISVESSHNYIHSNGHDKPIAIVGLKDIIVVDTPNGLLITHMDEAQLVKKVSEELEK